MKKKILVIYTGGTIGMVKDASGSYVPFSLENILQYVPQLNKTGVDLTIYSFEKLLDSAYVGPAEWLEISKKISNNYNDFSAFVILHGTDTMAYTASALSFLLNGLDKPVILTGSQIPINEEGTDGIDNFLNALSIAKEGLVNKVAIWFHQTLFNGCSVTKINSKEFDGFDSPNHEVLASLDSGFKYNKNAFYFKKTDKVFFDKIGSKVLFLNIYPAADQAEQASIIKNSLSRGIVISVLGSGTVPFKEGDVLFNALYDKNVPIIAVSQCLKGGIEVGKYESGSVLKKLNVISGQKITKEAALTKLIVALSNFDSKEKVLFYLKTNQQGEF